MKKEKGGGRMKKIRNPEKENFYLEKYHIPAIFDTKDLEFELQQYEKGELIVSAQDELSWFRFIVEGSFVIYAICEEGEDYRIGQGSAFTMFGDMEFADGKASPFYAEAAGAVLCLALSVERYGERLREDAAFLRFVMRSLAEKVAMLTVSHAEQRTLYGRVMQHAAEHGGRIEHIEETARQLHCSRRQLQRVLKKLAEEKEVRKLGKGQYRCLTLKKN